jgi:hypothetical protein
MGAQLSSGGVTFPEKEVRFETGCGRVLPFDATAQAVLGLTDTTDIQWFLGII